MKIASLLDCNVVQFGLQVLRLQKDLLTPSSGQQSKAGGSRFLYIADDIIVNALGTSNLTSRTVSVLIVYALGT
jgi:hypothetical protein